MKNGECIVYITVDGLRADRVIKGAKFLNKIQKKSASIRNFYTHGSPTQFAFPTIFTSTLPLDDGGYSAGIKLRGSSFVEALKKHGYKTYGVVSGYALGEYYGYSRGFDGFYDLNHVTALLQSIWKYEIQSAIKLHEDGSFCLKDLVEQIGPMVLSALICTRDGLKKICNTPIVIEGHLSNKYLDADEAGKIIEKIDHDIEGVKNSPILFFEERVLGKKSIYEVFDYMPQIRKASFFQRIAKRYMMHNSRINSRLNGNYAISILKKYVDYKEPSFVWVHLTDLHDELYSPIDYMRAWVDNTINKSRRALGSKTKNVRYDAALYAVDKKIRQIFDHVLSENKQSKFIISADHGMSAGGPRHNLSTAAAFFNEYCRIPFIIYPCDKNGMNKSCGQFSTLDVGPTVLDLAGIRGYKEFKGKSLFDNDHMGYEFIIQENLGRGSANLSQKLIKISVNDTKYKVICTEGVKSVNVDEIYDLVNDPDELCNRRSDPSISLKVEEHIQICLSRIKQIRCGSDDS